MSEIVELRTRIPGSVDDVWALLVSGIGAGRWLGMTGPARRGREVRLVGRDASVARIARIRTGHIEVAIQDPESHARGRGRHSHATISVRSGPSRPGRSDSDRREAGRSWTEVMVRETGLTKDVRRCAENGWSAALAAAWQVYDEAMDRRTPRQAVVLIHGIGEQVPGRTLMAFAEDLLVGETVLSKPDHVSRSFELRRLQVFQDRAANLPRTELFELYWAHRIRDTSLGQVVRWLWSLLGRGPGRLSRGLSAIWWLLAVAATLLVVGLVALVASAGLDGVASLWGDVSGWAQLGWMSLALSLVSGVVTGLLVNSLGDAARYLSPRPDNIAVRTEIRQAAVDLLERLHGDGRYHRVVLVGHSLGAVIGYDALTHYWSRVHALHGAPEDPQRQAARAYDREARAWSPVAAQRQPGIPPGRHRELQWDLWSEMRVNGAPWLVTDFVTLGSPLTHAVGLLAQDEQDLRKRQRSRELPTCAPAPDPQSGDDPTRQPFPYTYVSRYLSSAGLPSLRVLHHGAVFGPTRWTNHYFPVRGAVWGDLVGGPARETFGAGIRDVSLTHPSWFTRWTLKSHSAYWSATPRDGTEPRHADGYPLPKLRQALHLDCLEELDSVAARIPLSEHLKNPVSSETGRTDD